MLLGDSLSVIVLANLNNADPEAFANGIAAVVDPALEVPGDDRVYTYLVKFGTVTYRYTVSLIPDGRVSAFELRENGRGPEMEMGWRREKPPAHHSRVQTWWPRLTTASAVPPRRRS